MNISFTITSAQAADYQRCADLAGIDLADWIKQCAQVHATAAIDAMQATERQARTGLMLRAEHLWPLPRTIAGLERLLRRRLSL